MRRAPHNVTIKHRLLPDGQRECHGTMSRWGAGSTATLFTLAPPNSQQTIPQPYQQPRHNRSRILRKPLLTRARGAGELVAPSAHGVDLGAEFAPVDTSEQHKHTSKKAKDKGREIVDEHRGERRDGEDSEKAYNCPLCLEKRSNLSSLSCGHVFCTPCVIVSFISIFSVTLMVIYTVACTKHCERVDDVQFAGGRRGYQT